ncbi:hypothetical protein AB4Y86_18985, partial [Arthrobacter sp. 2YAF22_2]
HEIQVRKHKEALPAVAECARPALSDDATRNIAEVLDFGTPANLAAPKYLVPPFVAGPACTPVGPPPAEEWSGLKEKALADGWKLP